MDLPIPTEATLTALAQAAGAHALEWFLGLLALLAAIGMLARSVRHVAQRHGGRETAQFTRQSLGLGFALIVGAGLMFAGIAYEIGVGGTFVHVDRAFLEAVRASTSEHAVQVFGWITFLGDGLTLAVLCIASALALLAHGERLLAFALVAAMGGNGLFNAVLKRVFERVRPPHEPGLPLAHGWSFPSGHSSGAVVEYGMLAYVLMRTLPRHWHLPVVLSATVLALCVGCSRIFLEVHFASDVLAGFASGTAWLTACIMVIGKGRHAQSLQQRAAEPVLR